MNNEDLQIKITFRKFLLGEMSPVERENFEHKFITDEEMFDNLQVAEDELIEDYVRKNLASSDKNKFETSYLTTQKRLDRVAFAREMIKNLATQSALKKEQAEKESVSFWQTLVGLFKQPQFAFGSAFAILILTFGTWFLLKNSDKPVDVVQNTPTPMPIVLATPIPQTPDIPTVTPTPKIESKINQPNKNVNNQAIENRQIEKEIQANLDKLNTNTKPHEQKIKPTVSTLALFVGSVRGSGKTSELTLSKNSVGANLQLNLESQDYKNYRTEIVDQNGNVVFKSRNLIAKNTKLNTFVPANKLKRGDYIIKLYGKNAQNQDESVADYQFRVNQQ